MIFTSGTCFNISPGWQFNVLHIESSVENRINFALLFFKTDKFDFVIFIFAAKSDEFISFCSSKFSKFIIIAIIIHPLN